LREQRRAVRTELYTTRRVTRFTESQSTGSQLSTDVCLTTVVWPSSMITSSHISPVLCWKKDPCGSDWLSHGWLGQMQVCPWCNFAIFGLSVAYE